VVRRCISRSHRYYVYLEARNTQGQLRREREGDEEMDSSGTNFETPRQQLGNPKTSTRATGVRGLVLETSRKGTIYEMCAAIHPSSSWNSDSSRDEVGGGEKRQEMTRGGTGNQCVKSSCPRTWVFGWGCCPAGFPDPKGWRSGTFRTA